ncbi:hypothetical protein ACHQM5_014725 [Ranunculus cassubicifolius]
MSSSSPNPPPTENHQRLPPQQDSSRRVSFRLEPSPSRNRLLVHVPKDQIFGNAPLPENPQKDEARRSSGCCCGFRCWCTLLSLLLVFLTAAILLAVFVFPPKPPEYSIEKISFRDLNLTSSSRNSPTTNLILKVHNANRKIRFNFTEPGSIAVITQSDIILTTGVLPMFYQPERSTKFTETTLTSSFVTLYRKDHDELLFQENVAKRIPLKIDMKVPLKLCLFSMKSWTIKANVQCETSVDQFREDALHRLGEKCGCSAKWDIREIFRLK